jgi:CheY-like chemotaxis protein
MEVISHRDRPAPLALIVDDEALLALEIEDLLMAEGFRTLIAYTEAEVTTLAVEHLAVAVIDLSLGGDLAGQRVIRFLRNRMPKLPVVVVTGYDGQAPQANLRGLVLLCHKFALRVVRWQQGHRGSVRAMAWAMATRTEVIEFAT